MKSTGPIQELQRVVFSGLWNVSLAGAVAVGTVLTFALASSGTDALINDLARTQNSSFSIAWSAFPMLAGMVVPALVPLVLWLRGHHHEAIATLSAFVIALIIVSLLKGLTSRVHPEALEPATSLLRSQEFRFGLLRDGFSSVVEGWPSGHTATNGAVGLTFASLTQNRWLKNTSVFWVIWVTAATIFGISGDVHWLSDTVAGGLIAFAVTQHVIKAQTMSADKIV